MAASVNKTAWSSFHGESEIYPEDKIRNNVNSVSKQPIVSEEVMDIFLYVGFDAMTSAVCLFGIVANIINVIIFLKQGFKSTVNISLFGIAISDLGAIITLQWVNICNTPLLRSADMPFVAEEIQYLTGGVPHVFFSRVTSWFIAFVTTERCLSVTSPLKVKRIITPRRTAIALIVMFLVSFLSFCPEYFVSSLDWKFYKNKNRTLLGLVHTKDAGLGNLTFILTPLLGLISFVVVVVFTVILVVQLRQKSKWRKSATHNKEREGELSTRDNNTIKMVIVLASILIACNIPGAVVTFVTIIDPDIRPEGAYWRFFKVMWIFPFFLQAINASVNIFFYYRMSTKYRQSVQQLFSSCVRAVQN